MGKRALVIFIFCACSSHAVILDRIAVIVGNAIIKDSDIERNLRVTDLLNLQPLAFDNLSRKKAVSRLIDQIFIGREIRIGDYRTATQESADAQLAGLKKDRFKGKAGYDQALQRYGLTDDDLRTQFQWQLTVLNFIDARFKPAAYVSDQEIEKYYNEHKAALRRQFPAKTNLLSLQPDIRNVIAGEKVNQLFFAWLDEQRKSAKVTFREPELQ